jgi:BON domain
LQFLLIAGEAPFTFRSTLVFFAGKTPDYMLSSHLYERHPMLLRILSFLVICAAIASAQQPMPLPGQIPRGNPRIDPNEPETKKPKEHQSSSKDVAEKLQKALDSKNAAYRGSNIQSSVDDRTITLTGSVTSSMQRDMALQLARAYGEDRQIVDKLVIQP